MKKIILLLTTAILLYVSGSALEPVRIGMNYPTGANFKVQLVDYTDPGNPIQKYPLVPNTFFETNLIPNTSGVVSFVVGEGDPDWGGIMPNQINENVVIDVRVGNNLVAQFDFLEMITTQAATGNGNILNDGFTSSGGVTFSDTSNITNDFLFGSAKLDRLSLVDETKFFFDHSKAAFRTGIVGTDSWNENNLGNFSFAAGKDTKASGVGAVALGVGTTAPSYGEVAIGSYNTVYVPGSTSAIVNSDRAFVIGNGTAGTPSDAFIIQKNGNMTVGGSLTVLGATITNSALVVGGTTIDPNTGNLVVAGTTTMNGNASVTGANTFSVGNGLTTLGGGLTVTAGNIQATAGSISAGTTVTAGTGVTATSGGITADAGNITATLGNIEATAGSVSAGTTVTAGTGVTATSGGVTADAGNIIATLGNIEATAGSVSAGTTVTAGTGVTATSGGVTADAGNIIATLGNIEATVGSVTAGNGLTVSAGNTTLTSLGASGNRSLYVDNAGVVTASNGSSARQASGIFTGTHTTTANATQTITNANVVSGSVIMITYYGNVVATYTLGTITDNISFEVIFSAALPANDSIHYIIINN